MRLHGWCTNCHKIRLVSATNSTMAQLATRGIAEGICDACQDKEDKRRAEHNRARGKKTR